jgi:hypothetical protein
MLYGGAGIRTSVQLARRWNLNGSHTEYPWRSECCENAKWFYSNEPAVAFEEVADARALRETELDEEGECV